MIWWLNKEIFGFLFKDQLVIGAMICYTCIVFDHIRENSVKWKYPWKDCLRALYFAELDPSTEFCDEELDYFFVHYSTLQNAIKEELRVGPREATRILKYYHKKKWDWLAKGGFIQGVLK